MYLYHLNEIAEKELIPGFRVRFVHSEKMTIAYWNIAAGFTLPKHSHPHEQVVNIMDGELELVVDGVPAKLGPGDVVVLEPNVPHSGSALTDCRVIDVFHPVREDYRGS